MAVKIKTNTLAGYENTAFNYRYLNTTLTPLAIMEEAVAKMYTKQWLGDVVLSLFGREQKLSDWEQLLSFQGRSFDRTYRLLADEYYRIEEPSNA